MPELEQKTFQRQVAYKVGISDILNGILVKDEFSTGYIKLNNINISRVNIIATLVFKSEKMPYSSAIIDDATGKILLRSFDVNTFSKISMGDAVLVIGKIREFNNEKYILPEILKKLNDAGWAHARKLELSKSVVSNNNKIDTGRAVDGAALNIVENIYLLIKKLDDGNGVPIDDVIKNSDNGNVEIIINKLLESGDIFEIKPGKLKVLE